MGKAIFLQILKIESQNLPLLSLIARQEKAYGIQKETVNSITNKIKVGKQEYYQPNLVNIRSKLTCQQCRRNQINIEQSFRFYLNLSDLCLIPGHVSLLILLANAPGSTSISILITSQKMKFSVKGIFPADLIKFYDEILNGNFNFLCSGHRQFQHQQLLAGLLPSINNQFQNIFFFALFVI